MNKEQYQEYLKSEHWTDVKKAMRRLKSVPKCELCGTIDEMLDVHHISYENIGYENQSDLCVLCHSCHKKVHEEGINLKVIQDEKRKKYYDNLFQYLSSGMGKEEAIMLANKNRNNDDYKIHFISDVMESVVEDMEKYHDTVMIYR